ncbi:Glycosyltransferase involved in cell wall bisynthesis [Catalinimonas alkaloidigena]|uniref:Glycosyltransferase involved in cell wall bisynthesis n=1 Tax=Catalinimonas alkaloidigena TaxID=1075417 RepID=A0A1G9B380_9BACT|nr:glycosyltransferase family 4 protein [Catalinimonas alkaloidigena]SDK33928.1 Glycosyltransferase involved in cell wall bisynthesis [Catalinimonas alkaloidigena]
MRILQLTNRLPWPLNDGGNIATYLLTHHLHKRGHHLTLASLNTRKHHTDPAPLRSVTDEVLVTEVDTSFTALGLLKGAFQMAPYNVSRFHREEFAHLLRTHLQTHTVDLIQLEGIYLASYLPLLRRYSQAPVVLRAHNVEHQIWARVAAAERNLAKRWYLQQLVPKIQRFELTYIPRFDGIVAITEADAEFFRRYHAGKPLATIPAGPDPAWFERSSAAEVLPQSVGFLGSLEWVPNAQGVAWLLADIWPRVQAALPHATLHIAGKNPPPSLQPGAPVPTGVHLHGPVPDAAAFLERCQILVVPLLSGSGMRLKVVEALALGKCIVTTSIGTEGIPLQSGQQGWIADMPEAFAETLINLLQHPQQICATGQAARAWAQEQYHWDQLVRQFETFYASVS